MFIMKNYIILALFLLQTNFLFSQRKTDNFYNLGITEFDSLVYFIPDVNNVYNVTNMKYINLITEKKNLHYISKNYGFDRFNFAAFDSSCYLIIEHSRFIWENILPYLGSYSDVILYSYPRLYSLYIPLTEQYNYEKYYSYQILPIIHKKYLVLLMRLSFYNSYEEHFSEGCYLFHNSEFEHGLYVKVLIPLKEDE